MSEMWGAVDEEDLMLLEPAVWPTPQHPISQAGTTTAGLHKLVLGRVDQGVWQHPSISDQPGHYGRSGPQNQAVSGAKDQAIMNAQTDVSVGESGMQDSTSPPAHKKKAIGDRNPEGVKRTFTTAKCKCCGTPGFYTKSCGKKHTCLINKCNGGVPQFLDSVGKLAPTVWKSGVLHLKMSQYRVHCPMCTKENRFERPDVAQTLIECWECGNPMTIHMPGQTGHSAPPAKTEEPSVD